MPRETIEVKVDEPIIDNSAFYVILTAVICIIAFSAVLWWKLG
jgi:hypothetical protein